MASARIDTGLGILSPDGSGLGIWANPKAERRERRGSWVSEEQKASKRQVKTRRNWGGGPNARRQKDSRCRPTLHLRRSPLRGLRSAPWRRSSFP